MIRTSYLIRYSLCFSALVLIVIAYVTSLLGRAQPQAGRKYYVDCSASKNGSGRVESPWNSVRAVNSHGLFGPGDSILIRRGTTCQGELIPRGSGSPKAPITIDTYGVGARPIIDAASRSEALKLYNQQYWHINNIETSGGAKCSADVNGDESVKPLRHIYFTGCSFHDSKASAGAALNISQKGTESSDNASTTF